MSNPLFSVRPQLLALLLCTQAATAQERAPMPVTAPVVPPLYIIAPTEVRADPTLARGCWARLFPQPGFEGQNDLTIAGPTELPSLHQPTNGVYWKQTAESLIVGPKATVTIYEAPRYQGRSATLDPGSRQQQLRAELKFPQSIDSIRIRCEQ